MHTLDHLCSSLKGNGVTVSRDRDGASEGHLQSNLRKSVTCTGLRKACGGKVLEICGYEKMIQ